MIQANELRIGNWISDRGGKQWQIDCWEAPNKVAAKEPYMGELFEKPMYGHPLTEEVEYLQPIPLTPEILEKFGFEKDEDGIYLFRSCMYWLDDIKVLQIAIQYAVALNAPCAYLHQLQNLIFSLTGEELTFKP